MKRLIEQTLCEKCERFHEGERIVDAGCFGSGGSSREVTVDYEAAKDTAWSVLSFDELGDDEAVALVYDIVDAALNGGSE